MSNTNYAVILAARTTSDRLPGKAMAMLAPGIPVLGQIIERWRKSDRKPTIIVTTTTDPADDLIAVAASANGVPVSRGNPTNVVAQMDQALHRYSPHATHIARALADNPLVDVALADWRLDVLTKTGADGLWYGREQHNRITYAGTTDVWSRSAWDRIVAESSGCQLEHPGSFYWDRLSSFAAVQISLPRKEYVDTVRTELDTPADLLMFQAVWAAWQEQFEPEYDKPVCVPTLWALKWLVEHPDVSGLNAAVRVKTQSWPAWPEREKAWLCETCAGRVGSVKEGNLIIRCQNCGRARHFYSAKPVRKLGPRLGKENN